MATSRAKYNKAGELTGFEIRVFRGRDPVTGKQLPMYSTT